MKRLLQKKWFRRLVQTMIMVVSLLAAACAVTNWWGARMKRNAIAEWRAAGRPLTLSEMLGPLPPDAENFALLPMFVTVQREYAEDPDYSGAPRPGSVGYRMAEMGWLGGPRGVVGNYFRSERDQAPDFSEWAKLNGGESNAARLLGKFDEKYAGFLEELREGLSRPYTVPPRWHRLASNSEAMFKRGQPIHTLATIIAGLVLRTELALEAGRPEVAFESVRMGCRVADMLAAENEFIGALAQVSAWSRLSPALARGLDTAVWTEQQIGELRALIATGNEQRAIASILDLETLAMIGSFTGYREDREKMAAFFGAYSAFPFTIAKTPVLREFVPAGWYDAFLARSIRMNLAQVGANARAEKSLLDWCQASAAVDARNADRGRLSRAFMPDNDMGTHPRTLRERMSYAMVKRAQSLLACDLAIFRKRNGRYPAAIEELASLSAADPMTGQTFQYRTAGEGYVLYSVGIDGADNGGDKGDERRSRWDAPDWVW